MIKKLEWEATIDVEENGIMKSFEEDLSQKDQKCIFSKIGQGILTGTVIKESDCRRTEKPTTEFFEQRVLSILEVTNDILADAIIDEDSNKVEAVLNILMLLEDKLKSTNEYRNGK